MSAPVCDPCPANDNAPTIRTLFYGLNAFGVGSVVTWIFASQLAGAVVFSVALVALCKLGEGK